MKRPDCDPLINLLLEKTEIIGQYVSAGRMPAAPYLEFCGIAERAADINPVAKELPRFMIAQMDATHAQGNFEIALRDELGMDIRRWPEA